MSGADDAVRIVQDVFVDEQGYPNDPINIVAALRAAGHLRTPGTVEVKPNLIAVLREATAYAVRTYPPNGEPEQEPTDTWQSAIFVADAAIAAGENS